MNRADIESFFKTLLLGDFEENQNTAAQVVGGLISLIPVLDQVMDARDLSGSLFHISRAGGFKNASTDQVVNFGFAAFGLIPEVGSAFKTVFKPMWKERRAAKGAIHSGLNAIESLLGKKKGGSITWIRQELIGKWGTRTDQAISYANAGLASCIALVEFLATASGWKDWLVPDSIQELARQMLPGIKSLRGAIDAPLRRASNEIKAFLEDLLGEQAAAVVMAVGATALPGSAVPGARSKTGHNAAAIKPTGSVPKRQTTTQVGSKPKADAHKGGGAVHTAVQVTRKTLANLASQEKGLIGEHVVDYHELKRLGGGWPHDKKSGKWSPETVKKLNCDKRPVNLALHDLPKVNHSGIDAVWQHGGQLTVTEAKASASVGAVYGLGKFKEKKGQIPVVTGLSADHQMLHYLLSDSSDKRGAQTPLMQMGVKWVKDRASGEKLPASAWASIKGERASRRVALVTLESPGALAHIEALADIHMGIPAANVHPHAEHALTKVWEAPAIDAVDSARKDAHKERRAATTSASDKSGKPAKPVKGKKP